VTKEKFHEAVHVKLFLKGLVCVVLCIPWTIDLALAQNLPEDAVYIDRGVLAFSEKRYEDALKELTEALRLNPASHEALYYQGLVYQEINRPGEARRALERAHQLRPQNIDIAFQLGVLYVKRQDYDKAEPLLRAVYRAEPRRQNLGYYLGLIEYRRGNFRGAVEFFDENMPSDEEFAQLSRFYAGLAASALGFPRQARSDMAEALRLRSGSSLGGAIPRLNDLLEQSAKEEKRFRGEIRFGFVYDSNVPVVLDRSLRLAPALDDDNDVNDLIDSPSGKRGSTGELLGVDLSYSWLRTVNWESAIAYKLTFVEYNQSARFSNLTHSPSLIVVNRGTAGTIPYTAGTQWVFDHITVGHETALRRWTVNPFFTLLENANNATNLQVRLQVKNFSKDPSIRQEVRDAVNYMVGPTHYFLFENGRHYVKLGYQYDRDVAEGSNWDYDGNRALAGAQYTVPWQEIRLRFDFEYHWRSYRNHFNLGRFIFDPRPPSKRRDRELIHTVSAAKDFTVGAQKFNLSVEYLFDQAHSNFSAFGFSRHVAVSSVAWRF
jgi:tetratricopeptide (TPR) repeat protein